MKSTLKSRLIKRTPWILTAVLASLYAVQPANSGKFSRADTPSDKTGIWYTGTIEKGDAAKLQRVINTRWFKRGVQTKRIWVNLNGGLVMESMRVADIMTKYGMEIAVAPNKYCVSACLNLYVGAKKRWFTEQSYIGVHATLDWSGGAAGLGEGIETQNSRSATLATAEIWTRYGVPSNVIVKMLSTKGYDITWLTADDLVENDWSHVFEANYNY